MAKHTLNGFITYTQYGCEKPEIRFQAYKPSAEYSPSTVIVREHSIEVEVPDDFDPRLGKVESLNEQKRLVRAEFAKKVKEIDDQIASLLAIENNPS